MITRLNIIDASTAIKDREARKLCGCEICIKLPGVNGNAKGIIFQVNFTTVYRTCQDIYANNRHSRHAYETVGSDLGYYLPEFQYKDVVDLHKMNYRILQATHAVRYIPVNDFPRDSMRYSLAAIKSSCLSVSIQLFGSRPCPAILNIRDVNPGPKLCNSFSSTKLSTCHIYPHIRKPDNVHPLHCI